MIGYNKVEPPYSIFYGLSGEPLENGKIYVGVYGLNPITNPIPLYWDFLGTIPAAQPLRTINGYISRDGTPTNFYAQTNGYSILVLDKNDVFIYASFKTIPNSFPIGVIMLWHDQLSNIPIGWALCDGTNGTPDLRDRFIACSGGAYTPGTTFGNDSVTLTINQLAPHDHAVTGATTTDGVHTHTLSDPGHTHQIPRSAGGDRLSAGSGIWGANFATTSLSLTGITIDSNSGSHSHDIAGIAASVGGGEPIDIRPKAYSLCYIMYVGAI